MAWTNADFTARYPEMAQFPSDLLTKVLTDAEGYIPTTANGPYGTMRDRAVGLLAAHWLTQRIQQMGQNINEGGASFGMRLDGTVYGQELARLEAGLPVCGFVAEPSA